MHLKPLSKLLIVSLFTVITIPGIAQAEQQAFNKLFELSGTWKFKTKTGHVVESWLKINDSTLHGSSYRITEGDTVPMERIQLVLRGKTLQYIPTVTNQNNNQPVVFTLKSFNNSEYIFENLRHDFPQRIGYKIPANNELHAWIEGKNPSGVKKIDFVYKREMK